MDQNVAGLDLKITKIKIFPFLIYSYGIACCFVYKGYLSEKMIFSKLVFCVTGY